MSEAELATTLSPRHFIEVRTTHGGPAPTVTAKAVAASLSVLAADQQWLFERLTALQHAEHKRSAALARL
jgi:hypothetical protein